MEKFDIILKLEEKKMNIHNEINNDIKFLAKSEIRLKILSELYAQPNNVRGLVKKTNITYSSISSNISEPVLITSTCLLCTLHYCIWILYLIKVEVILCKKIKKNKGYSWDKSLRITSSYVSRWCTFA